VADSTTFREIIERDKLIIDALDAAEFGERSSWTDDEIMAGVAYDNLAMERIGMYVDALDCACKALDRMGGGWESPRRTLDKIEHILNRSLDDD